MSNPLGQGYPSEAPQCEKDKLQLVAHGPNIALS